MSCEVEVVSNPEEEVAADVPDVPDSYYKLEDQWDPAHIFGPVDE